MPNKLVLQNTNNNLFVVDGLIDDDNEIELHFTPIIAWQLDYDEIGTLFCTPITPEKSYPDEEDDEIVIDGVSKSWWFKHGGRGFGIDELKAYIRRQEEFSIEKMKKNYKPQP